MPKSPEFLHLWYAALADPIGIVVTTTDRDRLRAQLYAARREARDPDLEGLSLVLSPTDDTHVWIVRAR